MHTACWLAIFFISKLGNLSSIGGKSASCEALLLSQQ
jgi:hypothetical protein